MGGSTLGKGHLDVFGNKPEARAKTIGELDREECDAAVKSEKSPERPIIDIYSPLVPKEGPLAGGPSGVVIAESKVTQVVRDPEVALQAYNEILVGCRDPNAPLTGEAAEEFKRNFKKRVESSLTARENLAIENRLWETRKEQGDRIKQLEVENQGLRVELQYSKDATCSTIELLKAQKEMLDKSKAETIHCREAAEKYSADCIRLRKAHEKLLDQNQTLIHGIIRLMELLRNLEEK